jgi:hypothetical protein
MLHFSHFLGLSVPMLRDSSMAVVAAGHIAGKEDAVILLEGTRF